MESEAMMTDLTEYKVIYNQDFVAFHVLYNEFTKTIDSIDHNPFFWWLSDNGHFDTPMDVETLNRLYDEFLLEPQK